MGRNKITALLTVFLTFILFIILQPGDDPLVWIRIASTVAAVVIVLVVLYTHFLWRLEPFKRFHRVIDVSGKWVGNMPINDEKEIHIEVKIKQFYDDVMVEIKTNNNHSDSLVTRIINDPDGSKLYIVYKCKPNRKVESKDDIDYGTMILRMDEDILEGEFYNSKKITGRIELYRKD